MEKGSSSNRTVWIVIGLIAALLLGCTLGSCAGGLAGYGLSRLQGAQGVAGCRNRAVPVPNEMPRSDDIAIRPLLVTRIVESSPAEKAGLQVGDLVTALGGVTLTEENQLPDLLSRYAPGDQLTLTVRRNARELVIQITAGEHPADDGRAWLGFYYQQLPMMP